MAINYNTLTDKELAEKLSLHGTLNEMRLANYIFKLQSEILQLQQEVDELEEYRWES